MKPEEKEMQLDIIIIGVAVFGNGGGLSQERDVLRTSKRIIFHFGQLFKPAGIGELLVKQFNISALFGQLVEDFNFFISETIVF